jgi:hypothetical protein
MPTDTLRRLHPEESPFQRVLIDAHRVIEANATLLTRHRERCRLFSGKVAPYRQIEWMLDLELAAEASDEALMHIGRTFLLAVQAKIARRRGRAVPHWMDAFHHETRLQGVADESQAMAWNVRTIGALIAARDNLLRHGHYIVDTTALALQAEIDQRITKVA